MSSSLACAQKAPVGQVMRSQELLADQGLIKQVNQDGRILIRKITIEGFVLKDRQPFEQLFKPHLNKYLSPMDIDAILDAVKALYAQQGYQGMVDASYTVSRHDLKIRVFLTH